MCRAYGAIFIYNENQWFSNFPYGVGEAQTCGRNSKKMRSEAENHGNGKGLAERPPPQKTAGSTKTFRPAQRKTRSVFCAHSPLTQRKNALAVFCVALLSARASHKKQESTQSVCLDFFVFS